MPEPKDVAVIQQVIQMLSGLLQSEQSEPETQEGGGLREMLQKKVEEGGGLE